MKIVPEYWDEELECIPADRLNERRALKIQKHLRYAYQNSPFYRTAFDHAGIRPEEIVSLEDFKQRIPFLTHRDLIENQQRNPPFGDFLALGLKDLVRIYSAPGPLLMPFSLSDMDDFINTTANGLYICGARRGDIADVTAAYQWQLAGTMADDALRRIGCAVVPGGAGMAVTHLQVMRRLGVTMFFAFPSFAMKLVETAREMGIDLSSECRVRLIVLAPEICTSEEIETLAEAFGAVVRRMYGMAETGFVAAECSEGGGLHCFTESVLELIDPETGKDAGDGQCGEIVVTALSRRAMPIIRYRTGDIAEGLNHEPCACGRTSPRIKALTGRTGDVARVKGTLIMVEPIARAISLHKNIDRFQIVIEQAGFSDRLIIRAESSGPAMSDSARQRLLADLRSAILLKPELEIVPKGSIDARAPVLVDKRFTGAVGYDKLKTPVRA
jgi:phenylacetate-CoA ligase